VKDGTRQRFAIGCAALAAVLSIAYLATIRRFVQAYRVPNSAMEPTIMQGDHVLMRTALEAHRGDVIVFDYPLDPRVQFIKRIVGIGGDTVEVRAKQLFVNGRAAVEPYAIHDDPQVYPNNHQLPEPFRSRDWFGPATVPPTSYFVLGDNRDRSSDSRYWGFVPRANLRGRILYRFSFERGIRTVR
jgi:signal peptidase I